MGNERIYDVIVVGSGSMGSAADYFLAKEKKKVLMMDQYSVPNSNASHAGETRMLRFGYGQGEKYVPLVQEAYKLWKELEGETGKTLFFQTGALMAGESGSEFVEETIQSSLKNNLPIETLSPEEVMRRWPGIQIPEDFAACFDPLSGFLLCEECVSAYKEEALKQGAELMEHNAVLQISLGEEKVDIITEKGTYYAKNLVVTAGAWIPKVVKNLDLPIQVLRKAAGWFTPDQEGKFDYGKFPAFVFDTKEGHYYGFPNFHGSGLKIGRHDHGMDCNPDTVDRVFGSYQEDEGDLRHFLNQYMPSAANEVKNGKICLYSLTPDSDFIIDFHPEYNNVVLAGGFSGHGFKFASVVGRILADLALTGDTKYNISSFGLNRFEGVKVSGK